MNLKLENLESFFMTIEFFSAFYLMNSNILKFNQPYYKLGVGCVYFPDFLIYTKLLYFFEKRILEWVSLLVSFSIRLPRFIPVSYSVRTLKEGGEAGGWSNCLNSHVQILKKARVCRIKNRCSELKFSKITTSVHLSTNLMWP